MEVLHAPGHGQRHVVRARTPQRRPVPAQDVVQGTATHKLRRDERRVRAPPHEEQQVRVTKPGQNHRLLPQTRHHVLPALQQLFHRDDGPVPRPPENLGEAPDGDALVELNIRRRNLPLPHRVQQGHVAASHQRAVLLVALRRPTGSPAAPGLDVVVGRRDGETSGASGIRPRAKRQLCALAQRGGRRCRSGALSRFPVSDLPEAPGSRAAPVPRGTRRGQLQPVTAARARAQLRYRLREVRPE
mmetsp:Transcript_1474/g.5803  ORF Transcript_1474/g.5803 Transcript_1474/m.5803 type:complete len:244 (+) Transcript_1474:1030-1761(+)